MLLLRKIYRESESLFMESHTVGDSDTVYMELLLDVPCAGVAKTL